MSSVIDNTDNLKKYLLNNININKFDFIGLIVSGWHLNVLYSYINANKDDYSNGLIIINCQGNINNESKLRIKNNKIKNIDGIKIKYVIIKNHKEKKKIMDMILTFKNLIINNKNNTKKLTIISVNNVNISLLKYIDLNFNNRKLHFLEIDEGTGSYISKNSFLKGLNLNIFDRLKILIKLLIIKFLVIVTNNNIEKYYLFKKERDFLFNTKLTVNKNVANNLRIIFKKYNNFDESIQKNQILILKDFVKENSKIDSMYIDLVEKLTKLTGKKIYIKKHPNDMNKNFDKKINKFKNSEIIHTDYDAEDIFVQYAPEYIIGGISTALFSISAIYKKNVINISELYYDKKYKIPKKYLIRIIKFKKLFSENNYIKYIKQIEEFKKIIK
jgi:hypothetical protein